mgnify:CR=1 FL=1
MEEEGNVVDSARASASVPIVRDSPARFTRKMLSSAKPSEMLKSQRSPEDDSPSIGFSHDSDSRIPHQPD